MIVHNNVNDIVRYLRYRSWNSEIRKKRFIKINTLIRTVLTAFIQTMCDGFLVSYGNLIFIEAETSYWVKKTRKSKGLVQFSFHLVSKWRPHWFTEPQIELQTVGPIKIVSHNRRYKFNIYKKLWFLLLLLFIRLRNLTPNTRDGYDDAFAKGKVVRKIQSSHRDSLDYKAETKQ